MKAKSDSKPRQLAPEGTQIGRCYAIIDLGTQETVWKGEVKHQHKVQFNWELPLKKHTFDEKKGPEPFVVSQQFTFSIDDRANMRKTIENWLGRKLKPEEVKEGLDIFKLVGLACMIVVVHSPDKKYANVGSISPLMDGMTCPPLINPTVKFEIGSENQFEEFKKVYKYLQEKIEKSPEWKEQMKGVEAQPEEEEQDEITKASKESANGKETNDPF